MGALPVIAGVFRCTITMSKFQGVQANNVFHVQAPTANENDVFALIDSHFTGEMIDCTSATAEAESITVLALDGASAGVHGNFTSPPTGSGTGEIMPACAAVLSLYTVQRGSRGRGRLFLGPTTEDKAANGLIDSDSAATMIGAWGAFGIALGAATPLALFGVASYKHSDFHPINHLDMHDALGTQRRRQKQLQRT